MGKPEKQAMVALITRCANTVRGEVTLLIAWRNQCSSTSRAAACAAAAQQIRQGPLARVDATLDRATQTPADDVLSHPTATHRNLVKSGEDFLEMRKKWDPNELSPKTFGYALQLAKQNATLAARDAATIHGDGLRP